MEHSREFFDLRFIGGVKEEKDKSTNGCKGAKNGKQRRESAGKVEG